MRHLRRTIVIGALAGALAGCGGAAAGARRGGGVESAGMPFRVLRGHGGQEVAAADFYAELARAPAVCVGETHDDPHHHWVQLRLVDELSRAAGAGATLALGMEMFQRPFQGVLDDYRAGRIDEPTLLARTFWKERWGFDWALYRPIVRVAVARGLALLALNAPRELTHKVAEGGLEALSPSERAELPATIDLGDRDHRAWFDDATKDHGAAGADADRFYAAQVVWDETMADSAAAWLAAGPGGSRRVLLLAGSGHCHDLAIPMRLRRRGVAAVSVLPIIDDGGAAVANELATPRHDYLVVLQPR